MIWWVFATVFAFFIKGLCGFANSLIFTSILSFGNSNVNISPVELILGYPTNIIMAWKERRSINWRMCLPLSLLVLGGIIPGVLFLKNADTTVMKTVFGVVIILIGLEMLIREFQTKKIKQSKIVMVIIGILSGLLCGLFGIGALLGAYVNRVTDDSSSFKANVCVVFFVESSFRLIMYSVSGIITLEIVKQAVVLMPLMLLGLALGMLSGKILNEKLVKRLVIIMLIISGVALLANNL